MNTIHVKMSISLLRTLLTGMQAIRGPRTAFGCPGASRATDGEKAREIGGGQNYPGRIGANDGRDPGGGGMAQRSVGSTGEHHRPSHHAAPGA